jgi:serine O-acetyltransferase
MSKPAIAAEPQIKSYDPVWSQVRREAEEISAQEPALGGFLYASVLSHARLEDAVCHRLARRLQHAVLDPGLIHKTFHEVLDADPTLGEEFRADLMAWAQRDPACDRLIEPLLYFKGFHALQTYRVGHRLWNAGRKDLALCCGQQLLAAPRCDVGRLGQRARRPAPEDRVRRHDRCPRDDLGQYFGRRLRPHRGRQRRP